MTKLPTELTNEELVKLLEVSEVVKSSKNKYVDFVSKYNITSGEHRVSTEVLYELFKFSYPKISQKTFTRNMKKYMEYSTGHHNNVVYFYINKDLLEVSNSIQKNLLKKPQSKRQVRNRKKHIEDFLEFYNLKPGNISINMSVVFDFYDSWCYKYKRKKLSVREFYNLITIYLPVINNKYYKVSNELFKIVSEQRIRNITKRHEKEKN